MNPLQINKLLLEASLCRDSFYDFFLRFWDALVPEQLVVNWHHKLICDEVQMVLERVFRRQPKEYDLIINVSPGTTKSIICSEMAEAWAWTRDPSLRFICGSYAMQLSMDLADRCNRIIACDKYKTLFPEVQVTSEAVHNLKTSKGGQRFATATGSAVTGIHAHCLVIDDPIDPKSAGATSGLELETANRWLSETIYQRVVDRRITPLILVAQRLAENDPPGVLLENKSGLRTIRHLNLPAELTDDVRPRYLRRMYKDCGDGLAPLFDPVRLPRAVLERARLEELGEYGYCGQYLQSPIPRNAGMFRTDLMENMIVPPTQLPKMVQVGRGWDKAGSSKKGCFTAGVKIGRDFNNRWWVLDVVRGQWEAAEREHMIRRTAETDGRSCVQVIEEEPGSGGKDSAMMTVKNLGGYRVVRQKPSGDKVLRADVFAAQCNAGNVGMMQGLWNRQYLQELRLFSSTAKFKDQVDATSVIYNWLTRHRLKVGGL